jgi:hypothetical protein
MIPALLFALAAWPAAALQAPDAAPDAPRGRAEVWRLDAVETLDGETQKNVTLLVRDGVIERMGPVVVVPEGARVRDLRDRGAVASPPLVLARANFLVGDQRGTGNASRWRAADSLWLDDGWEKQLLAEGVLFAGVDPPGTGMPGRTSVLQAGGGAPRPQALVNDLYLKITFAASAQSKDLVRKALKDAEEAIEKEQKAREEWRKARTEWEKKQKEKAEKEKSDAAKGEKPNEGGGRPPAAAQEKEEKEPPAEFEAPKFAPDVEAVVEWIRKERMAQVFITSAADWVHWQDLMEERELPYALVLNHAQGQNFHEVVGELARAGVTIDVPASISFLPFTRIRANLPAELARAGLARMVLSPAGGSLRDLAEWRAQAARCVAEGLDRARALRAMTLDAAYTLGLDDRVQALAATAPANFVVWSGDPLDPLAEALYVVQDGKIVYDREKEEKEEARR